MPDKGRREVAWPRNDVCEVKECGGGIHLNLNDIWVHDELVSSSPAHEAVPKMHKGVGFYVCEQSKVCPQLGSLFSREWGDDRQLGEAIRKKCSDCRDKASRDSRVPIAVDVPPSLN